MITQTESKRIFLVTAILAILLIGIFIVRSQRKASLTNKVPQTSKKEESRVLPSPTVEENLPGIYTVSISPKSIKQGGTVSATVSFVAEGKILDGGDAVLNFDPGFLSANSSSITTGDYFDLYPRKEADNEKGIVKVTAISTKTEGKPIQALTSLFTISFAAKKAGTTKLTLDFDRGATNKSTLVEHGTSKNILGSVGEVLLEIK